MLFKKMQALLKAFHLAVLARHLDFVTAGDDFQFGEDMRQQVYIGILLAIERHHDGGLDSDYFFHILFNNKII